MLPPRPPRHEHGRHAREPHAHTADRHADHHVGHHIGHHVGHHTGRDDEAARHHEVARTIAAWDEAMLTNDATAIGAFMADEWTITGADASTTDKATFLASVASGAVMHDEMTSHDVVIRLYGDTAVVRSRGHSGGTYEGQRFREHEQATNVFVRAPAHTGGWRCVATHLSRVPDG